ncbi:hypothetical protein KY285_019184 [Solanum tuberosum]|nr:hypothetical protein KY285_019184 [Solanum tuberosum]
MFQLSKIQNLIQFIKWTWDFLLLQSFPHYNNTNILNFKLSTSRDELCVRCFREEDQLDSSSIECAVCLCEIEEGEQKLSCLISSQEYQEIVINGGYDEKKFA